MSTSCPRAPTKCSPPCAPPATARPIASALQQLPLLATSAPQRFLPLSTSLFSNSSSRLPPSFLPAPPLPLLVSTTLPHCFLYALSRVAPPPPSLPSFFAYAVAKFHLPALPLMSLPRARWLHPTLHRCCAKTATAPACLSWRPLAAAAAALAQSDLL